MSGPVTGRLLGALASARTSPLAAAVALAAGIAAAPLLDRLGVAPWSRWLIAAAVIVGWRQHRAVVVAAAFALGAARGAVPPVVAPAGAVIDDRAPDRVTGVVRGPVMHGARGDGALLDTGDAALWLWSDERLVPGERVAVTGAVHIPRGLRDPAVSDRAGAARARGADLEVTARSLERLGDAAGPVDRAWRWAGATQAAWAAAIDPTGEHPRPAGRAVGVPTPRDPASPIDPTGEHPRPAGRAVGVPTPRDPASPIDQAGGDPIGRAALRGIAVGDRSGVPPALDQRWRDVGIFHVLSVSGLHLAVVAGLMFGLLRRLIAASPWGGRTRPARWAAPPALVLAIGYTMITGAQLATLRSLIVIALVLIAQVLDRPLRLIDALGVAALAILSWRPADLLDPSFQLSFVAALTLALGPAHGEHRRGVRGWLMRGLASSVRIALTTAPLTAYHFQQVAAGGVLGNLVLTPLVELIALPLGLAGVVLGIEPAIAAAAWIVGIADRGAGALALITPVGHVAVASTTMMAILVALSLVLVARAGRPAWRDRITAALWLALCVSWSLGRSPPPPGALRVTFLDVGQGDAALVELPDGAVWLIDAGGNPGARDLAQAAAPGRAIDRVLAAYGHAGISLAILSHPHPDHYLGLAALEAPIDELWTAEETDGGSARVADRPAAPHSPSDPPGRPDLRGLPGPADTTGWTRHAPPGFAAISAALAARGTRIHHPSLGIARREAGVELAVWAPRYQPAPDAPVRCATDPVRTVNDNSLVIALAYRGRTIVLAGDVEAEGEDVLVAAGLGRADVVKVPHHGSPTSSTREFIAATHPRLAVISCGPANAFGFPSADVVDRWRAAGAEVARTDRDGAITVTIDREGALAIDRHVP